VSATYDFSLKVLLNIKNKDVHLRMKQNEMITLTKKEIDHVNDSLKWGEKKVICIELGLKYSALSRYLKAIPSYNIKRKCFDAEYKMPLHVYNTIINFINNK